MATKDRKLNAEELELVGLLLEQKAREADRTRYHDWGDRGKTTHTYCRPIRRKGDEKPLFRKEWVHRFIKSKIISMSLFPDAKKWEYICPGPGCPICAAITQLREYADQLDEKNRVKRAGELRQLCQSGKTKELRHWVGITYDSEGSIKAIEPYRLSNWYFEKSLLDLLTEKKYTLAQWIKKHPELKKKKDPEREAHWIEHCPPDREFPDNPKSGWKFFMSKSGAGLQTKYKAKFEENVPLTKDSAEVKALKEAITGGDYPNLDAMLKVLPEKEMAKSVGALNNLLMPKLAIKEEEELNDGPEDELSEEDLVDDDDDEATNDDDSDDDDDETTNDNDDDDDDNDSEEEEEEAPKKKKKKKKDDDEDDSWEDVPF